MRLTSPAFANGEPIPARFTCDGADVSPTLEIADLPEGTACLALIMDDPDAPVGTWDHWVAYDMPATAAIPEGVKALGTAGRNSWRKTGYGGPCPPFGEHRYYFRAYALDRPLGLPPGASKKQVIEAMRGRILAEASLMGRYTRR
jgi:Raf kinase inhibitor-like YbhB/YbcL family protein